MIQARGNLEARSFVRRDLTACEETRLQSLVIGTTLVVPINLNEKFLQGASMAPSRLSTAQSLADRLSSRRRIPAQSSYSCSLCGTGIRYAQARVFSGSANRPETYPFRDLRRSEKMGLCLKEKKPVSWSCLR